MPRDGLPEFLRGGVARRNAGAGAGRQKPGVIAVDRTECYDRYLRLGRRGAVRQHRIARIDPGGDGVPAPADERRKVFGGGLLHAWPYAAVALHYLEGFAERFGKAVTASRALFARLQKHPRFRVELVPNGTNVVTLHVQNVDAARYQAALKSRGVIVRGPGQGGSAFLLVVNESLNRRPADDLARAFIEALPQ